MPEVQVRELTFAQAVREALAEEMRRDSRVCILGEDVAEAGTPFKVLSGLVEEFGTHRVIDTPIIQSMYRDSHGEVDQAVREQVMTQMRALSPLGLVGRPIDAGLALLYLASDASRFVTGTTLRVSGGV